MKKILISILFFFLLPHVANAGMFDDLADAVNDATSQVQEATKAKEMARVELPLKAIQKNDPRINKIESLAVQAAMKHKWVLQVACPDNSYCKKIKKSVDDKAWKTARSTVSSDYAAKGKLPKIQMSLASDYHLVLMQKGF